MDDVVNFEDTTFLRCSFCNESFKDPYILHCLHSFCNECVSRQKNDKESVKCKRCEQISCMKDIRPNYFYENIIASLNFKKFEDGGLKCGNCANENCLLMYCKECRELLCDGCLYCHQNTKLTRGHSVVSLDEYKEKLVLHGQEHAVFCHHHVDQLVEEYCRSCEESVCRGCEIHQEHNTVSVAQGCSFEVLNLEVLLERAMSKVDTREKYASLYCSLVDELRGRKSALCDKITAYFTEYREKVQKQEEGMLREVLEWFNKQLEFIKQQQSKEELRIKKIKDAVNFSQILLHHGTDSEILSLKLLVQSQLNRVANQKTETNFISSIDAAIRNASWNASIEIHKKEKTALSLPLVQDDLQSDEGNGEIRTVAIKQRNQQENKRNKTRSNWLNPVESFRKRRGNSGIVGRDFLLGNVIPRENSTIEQVRKEIPCIVRDYRYDKIMRNRSIGRHGTGYGEFQHPCDIAVDCKHDDRLIVSDFNNHRIQVFSYFGKFLFHFGSQGCGIGQFNGPTGVSLLHDGSIIVCDSLNNRVQIFSNEGEFRSLFGAEGRADGELWRPMGVAVNSQDRVVVVDQGNNRVQVFNSGGEFLFKFGKLGNWDGEVSCPNFVAVDKEDNIYISDEINMRIQVFRKDGSFLRKISAKENHGFQAGIEYLSGVAVDNRGHVIVGVKSSCSVRVFTPEGRYLRSFSFSRGCTSRPLFASGIALTSAGEIVVCDSLTDRIRFF